MNKGKYFLSKLLLICIFHFYSGNQIYGQEKLNISAGLGFPELLNLGIGYQFHQSKIGLELGFMPIKDEKFMSVSGDFSYHFADISKSTGISPWYGKIGLYYLRDETKSVIDKIWFAGLRFGRELKTSDKFIISIDGGLGLRLKYDQIEKEPSSGWFTLNIMEITKNFALPMLGICFIWRI